MSAKPQPTSQDERPVILPIPRDTVPTRDLPAGYAMIPKHITRHPHLKAGAKVVLDAIIGLCYGTIPWTRATATEIADAAGVSRKTVRRALPRLLAAGVIARRPDPERIGGPWLTHVLCHWKREKSSVQSGVQVVVNECTTPTPNCGTPLPQVVVPPYPKLGGGPLCSNRFIEESSSSSGRSTEADDDASSSSTQEESKTPPAPAPALADLVAQVRAIWPDEPDLDHRVAELVDLAGAAKATLAVEYAVARRVKGLGYTFVLAKSWRNLTAAECAERVAGLRAKRPTPSQALPPAHVAAKPPSQDVDPVFADLMRQFNQARGPRKAEIAAMMAARSAELSP
ncbi:MAG: hypothetical protein ACXWPK_00165 [Isosphaeraceae bacterium]